MSISPKCSLNFFVVSRYNFLKFSLRYCKLNDHLIKAVQSFQRHRQVGVSKLDQKLRESKAKQFQVGNLLF